MNFRSKLFICNHVIVSPYSSAKSDSKQSIRAFRVRLHFCVYISVVLSPVSHFRNRKYSIKLNWMAALRLALFSNQIVACQVSLSIAIRLVDVVWFTSNSFVILVNPFHFDANDKMRCTLNCYENWFCCTWNSFYGRSDFPSIVGCKSLTAYNTILLSCVWTR